jgi:hypothetical protein
MYSLQLKNEESCKLNINFKDNGGVVPVPRNALWRRTEEMQLSCLVWYISELLVSS